MKETLEDNRNYIDAAVAEMQRDLSVIASVAAAPGDIGRFRYHNFCDPQSVFGMLEREGLVRHRVGAFVEPGQERDLFVPEVATRAMARARFIRDHAGEQQYVVDWSGIWHRRNSRYASLEDPFIEKPGLWTSAPEPGKGEYRSRRTLRQLRELLGSFGDVPFGWSPRRL